MKLKTVFILLISILLTTSIILGTATDDAAKEKKAEKCPGKVKVLVQKVVPTTFKEYKALEKRVLPARDHEISAEAAGIIKKIEKNVGNEVNKGDVILILESVKVEKEIEEAAAKVKQWKRKLYQRQHWKVRSERAEEQAQEVLAKAEQELKAAEKKLAACTITSPATGTIGSLKANEGDHVSEGYQLGNVVFTKVVKVVLTQYAANVTDGSKVKVKIKEISAEAPGIVKKDEDGSTNVYIKNTEGKILVGMTAHFKVLVKIHPNSIALPKDKVFKDDTGEFVFLSDGKRAHKTLLKTGPVDPEGNVLILEGLTADDELIVSEILSAKEGTLKDCISCLEDNKKIKVLEKDEETGKFVKTKAVKQEKTKKEDKAETPKVEKKKKIKKVKKAKLEERKQSKVKIGANLSYSKMSEQNFEDVYGRMVAFGLDLSYMITPKIDLWLSWGYSSKKADLPDFPDANLTFKYMPISLDVRYYFKKSRKFDFLAGAGLSIYPFEESQNLEFANIKETAIGFNALAGTYYHLNDKFSLQLLFRLNMVKKTISIEDVDNDLNMNGIEMLFGVSYNL